MLPILCASSEALWRIPQVENRYHLGLGASSRLSTGDRSVLGTYSALLHGEVAGSMTCRCHVGLERGWLLHDFILVPKEARFEVHVLGLGSGRGRPSEFALHAC